MQRRLGATLLGAALLVGCSAAKVYPDVRPANVRIHSQGSAVETTVHIHRVGANCQTEYEGSARLEQPALEIGVPAGRTSVLAVTFSSSSLLRGSSSSVRYATLLTPRAGYRYDVKVSYRDSIYEVVVHEVDTLRNSSRQLARRDPSACKPS